MDIIISNASGKPIYEQITSQMKNLVLDGTLAEGTQLPSIRMLANDLKVSVITTKRAYADLEAQGFIETVPGKGSFVAGGNMELPARRAPETHRGPDGASGRRGEGRRRLAGRPSRHARPPVGRLTGFSSGNDDENAGVAPPPPQAWPDETHDHGRK